MTIEINTMKGRYELAEKLCFAKLKPWQQAAITEDRAAGKDSGLLHQFCKDVIKTAEEMVIAPPNAVPPIKKKIPVASGSAYPQIPDWHHFNGANGGDPESEE